MIKKIAIVCMMMFSFGCASQATLPANAASATPKKALVMTYDISGPNKIYCHVKAHYLCGGAFTVVAPTREVQDDNYHVFVTCNDP